MSTSITINGQELEAGQSLEDAMSKATASPYLIIRDGKPVEAVMWDGVSPFDPGDAAELVAEADWKGDPYTGPDEPQDAKARRTTTERLDNLLANIREDLKAFDTMTAAQRQASQKRTLRGVLLLARVVRDDHNGEAE